MEISTIEIATVDMLCASFYDYSWEVTKCALIVAIDQEQRCIFAVYTAVELEWPFRFTRALGAGDAFSFER
jgi:hypothetical protein